jgi:hypothetical protein
VTLAGLERLGVRDAELQADLVLVEQVVTVKLGLEDSEGELEDESEAEVVTEEVTEGDMETEMLREEVKRADSVTVALGERERVEGREAELQADLVIVSEEVPDSLGLGVTEGEEEEDWEGEALTEGEREGDMDTEMLRVSEDTGDSELVAFSALERLEVRVKVLTADPLLTREALLVTVPLLDKEGDREVEEERLGEAVWDGDTDGEVVTEAEGQKVSDVEAEAEAEGDTL